MVCVSTAADTVSVKFWNQNNVMLPRAISLSVSSGFLGVQC